jgi:hypothetical protein
MIAMLSMYYKFRPLSWENFLLGLEVHKLLLHYCKHWVCHIVSKFITECGKSRILNAFFLQISNNNAFCVSPRKTEVMQGGKTIIKQMQG